MNCRENDEPSHLRTDDEIDLFDLLLILWKRKWIVTASTILMTTIAIIICIVLPPIYEVTTILEPGKDADGTLLGNPLSIRENILAGAYNDSIAQRLKLSDGMVPKFKVVVPKKTDLVKIAIETSNPRQGVEILNALTTEVSSSLDERLDFKIGEAKNQIKAIHLQGQTFYKQAKLLGKQLIHIENKIKELEKRREQAIQSLDDDALAVLLYSNEVQSQQIYFNELQERLLTIEEKRNNNGLIIENAQLKLESIKGTNINKIPSVPDRPIKPKKKLIVFVCTFIGIIGGIILVFIVEILNRMKSKNCQYLKDESTLTGVSR